MCIVIYRLDSNGIVSSIREDEDFGLIIQTTTPISKGSSGSPLINNDGEIVGILSFYLADASVITAQAIT